MKVDVIGGIFGRDPEFRAGIAPTPEMTLVEGLRRRGVEVRALPHTWVPDRPFADVIHVHHLAKGAVSHALLRSIGRGRLVFTRHGSEAEVPAMHALTLRFLLARADAIVALSEAEATLVRERARGLVATIANGTTFAPSWTAAQPPAGGEPWRLLFVGQLIPLKNVDVLLRAVAALRGHLRIAVRIVYHNAELEAPLRDLAARLGLAEHVDFIGKLGSEGLEREYEAAHALVLPSSSEALPSVVTEALGAARPVVASAVGGIPEQVGAAGLLVPPRDEAALVSAIRGLTAQYGELSEAASERARHVRIRYSVSNMVDGHLDLYRMILRGPSTGSLLRSPISGTRKIAVEQGAIDQSVIDQERAPGCRPDERSGLA